MADGWYLAVREHNVTKIQLFDVDEIGTLDDILTTFFINDLSGIDQITITRKIDG